MDCRYMRKWSKILQYSQFNILANCETLAFRRNYPNLAKGLRCHSKRDRELGYKFTKLHWGDNSKQKGTPSWNDVVGRYIQCGE